MNQKNQFESLLNEYGHRNWIVVADYGFPSQSGEDLNTIFTGQGLLETLDYVLARIEKAPHITPKIFLADEINILTEELAPGIVEFRSDLESRIANYPTFTLPHSEVLTKLQDKASLYKVLVMKTDLTVPYTSIFIELDCGYWNEGKEKMLRDYQESTVN